MVFERARYAQDRMLLGRLLGREVLSASWCYRETSNDPPSGYEDGTEELRVTVRFRNALGSEVLVLDDRNEAARLFGLKVSRPIPWIRADNPDRAGVCRYLGKDIDDYVEHRYVQGALQVRVFSKADPSFGEARLSVSGDELASVARLLDLCLSAKGVGG